MVVHGLAEVEQRLPQAPDRMVHAKQNNDDAQPHNVGQDRGNHGCTMRSLSFAIPVLKEASFS